MNVYICAILKLENHYIREWVEYYKSLGFDKVILYDNNDVDGETLYDVIGDFIDDGYVIVNNYRGIGSHINGRFTQDVCYFDCYKTYSNECDWIAFFDIDEFLVLHTCDNIHDFLSQSLFDNFQSIKINWLMFDDNDIVESNGNYNLVNRFTRFCDVKNDNTTQVKSIIRTKQDIRAINCHGKTLPELNFCNVDGIKTDYKPNKRSGENILNDSYVNAQLNHYRLKTIQEFIDIRIKRGDMAGDAAKHKTTIDYFFMFNNKTEDKILFLKNRGYYE